MKTSVERFCDSAYRHRFVIFALGLLHVFAFHYIYLGYTTWDGFSYRVTPIIELVQHGALNRDKYPLDWSLRGYFPFVELVHVPFLLALGLRGLIIGFPFVVFPLCTAAVFLLVREVTGDKRAGLFGAAAYAAMPMVNNQAFAGYVDFAVAGILAYWLFALVRFHAVVGVDAAKESAARAAARLAVATFLLSMARQQGVLIGILLFPIICYAASCTRERWRVRIANRRALALGAVVFAIGAIPAIVLLIYKWNVYGSPMAPAEFRVLGIQLAPGTPIEHYMIYAGIGGNGLGSLAKGFFHGFVFPGEWPVAFWSSTHLATGLIFHLAIALLPLVLRKASRIERWVLVGCVLASYLSKDFGVPRWAYTLIVAIAMIAGHGMSALATSKRAVWFWIAFGVLALHAFRPELDFAGIKSRVKVANRMNVADSPRFLGFGRLDPYPDKHARLVLIGATGFTVQLFGLDLTNEVVGTVFAEQVDRDCKRLQPLLEADPDVLFVDYEDVTKTCKRSCAFAWGRSCAAYRIEPAR
jgi:hypothetical protein